jgi:hypothetical protein
MKTETEKLIELYHRMPVDQLETALQADKETADGNGWR